jgi:hypothetical protein
MAQTADCNDILGYGGQFQCKQFSAEMESDVRLAFVASRRRTV